MDSLIKTHHSSTSLLISLPFITSSSRLLPTPSLVSPEGTLETSPVGTWIWQRLKDAEALATKNLRGRRFRTSKCK